MNNCIFVFANCVIQKIVILYYKNILKTMVHINDNRTARL